MNITKEWTKTKGKPGAVVYRQEYTVGGVTYKVDGRHVVLKPLHSEITVANVLAMVYGKTVELVPKVNYPPGVQMPDYLIDGVRYDLKSPTGSGKHLLKGLIARKRKQADNFVVDISNCPLDFEEIERQINGLYTSPQVGFLMKLVLLKDKEIVGVYDRKENKNHP